MNRWKFLFSGCLVNGPVSGLAWAALLLAFAHGPLWGVEVEARNLCSATAWKLVRVAGPDAEVALDGLVMQPGKSHRVDFQVPGTYRWKVKEADQDQIASLNVLKWVNLQKKMK